MSMKKAGITIFSLLIMFIIILLTVRGCTISKKSEQKDVQNSQPEVVLQEKNNTTEKENKDKEESEKVKEDSKNTVSNTEKSGIDEEETPSVESSRENADSVNTSNSNGVSSNSTNSNNSFIEIGEPVLGESITVNALVSSKKSYLVDGKSYAYSIGVLLPNEDGYDIVNYYCPKKTYDAISSGESIKVDYQIDESGKVSINSISK
jgi:hypothetical protein